MLSDEILEKMVKNYELTEYGSEVEWRTIASNGINLSRTKFVGNTPTEIDNYKNITDRMIGK